MRFFLIIVFFVLSVLADSQNITKESRANIDSPLVKIVRLSSKINENGTQKSYGIWLKGGFILASSKAVYRETPLLFANNIGVETIEIPGNVFIRFGKASVIGVDADRALALLAMDSFSDRYGNLLTQKNTSHISTLQRGIDMQSQEYNPSQGYLRASEGEMGDFTLEESLPRDEPLGSSWWDTSGNLMAFTTEKNGELARIDINVVRDFLCEIKENKIMLRNIDELLENINCNNKDSDKTSPKVANFK
ncbi:MAG: hypothetical protein ACTTJS_07470 [Wolinella sp.]